MKKILCFMLTLLLVFNTTLSYTVYAIGSQPSQEEVEKFKQDLLATGRWYEGDDGYLFPIDTAADKLRKFIEHGITVPKLVGEGAVEIAQVLSSFFDNADNYQKNVKTDGQYVYFDNDFTNNINIALQDKVHALDGYFMIVPPQSKDSFDASILIKNACDLAVSKNYLKPSYVSYVNNSGNINKLQNYASDSDAFYTYVDSSCDPNIIRFSSPSGVLYLDGEIIKTFYLYSNGVSTSVHDLSLSGCYIRCHGSDYVGLFKDDTAIYTVTLSHLRKMSYGAPIRVFYSQDDARNYYKKLYANKPTRRYVPKLPSGGFKVNIKYINNTTNLPDITYNITTENKTETEIQNQYDTTINNYLNSLDDFTDGGGGNTPTPTPSGGGSGDFGDGSTPTPTPPLGDGGSDQDGDGADGWLKKIYDQLVKLSDSVSQHFEKEETFEDKLSKYLESHDKKLDAIVDAIDKLSQGKEEGEEKGCKYDYTELSDFMTKLWNDSDQKFDQMVELLKENNEYQEKMLSTLNSIKNILKAQTVMDAFKNRSSETANKAKEKFPTSVPWDIALVINTMDAEPKAPVFELPIKIERLNIDEKITVDISSGEWEKLAKVCRYMLSLLFVLFMVNLTRKLFFSKGDD